MKTANFEQKNAEKVYSNSNGGMCGLLEGSDLGKVHSKREEILLLRKCRHNTIQFSNPL